MTEHERIKKLLGALVAARYEIVWWYRWAVPAKWRARILEESLLKYDRVIEVELLEGQLAEQEKP